MGNTCPGSKSMSEDEAMRSYMADDRVKPIERSGKYAHVGDGHTNTGGDGRAKGHGAGFFSTFDPSSADGVSMAVLIEHYQPYEFPICPVLNSDTQKLVRESWAQIMATEFDSSETASGKVSGASYFYNHFFNQLFNRLADFSRIFPDIKSRADIFSKVMAFCISIRIEELEMTKMKLKHLGQMHKSIIHHPYLFGIYASNMHSTIRHCLGENASHETMSAWLHLLSFILRGMLPAYFAGLNFAGHYAGAVNAASTINEKARDEVRTTEDMKQLKSKLASLGNTEPPSRYGGGRRDEEPTGRSMTQIDTGAINPAGNGNEPPISSKYDRNGEPLVSPVVENLKRGGIKYERSHSPISGKSAMALVPNPSDFPLPGSTRAGRIPEDE